MDQKSQACSNEFVASEMSRRLWIHQDVERAAVQVLATAGREQLVARIQKYFALLIEQRCPPWAQQYPERPTLLGRTGDSGDVRTRASGDVDELLFNIDFQVHTPNWGPLNEWRWRRWAKLQLEDAVALAIEDFIGDDYTTET